MSTFSKKKLVEQKDASDFVTEVTNLIKLIILLSEKLKTIGKEAKVLKESKETEIATLKDECSGLTTISDYALHIAAKLDNILY